ncbi:Translation initiation factor eIF-2B subunit delta [Melia azedarach]|uniref:Translation initiation factor eIF-2B subunit delta n=1 Tax=Melia azedarach TaxID=155640 RepID=A0ACC1X719_MELAZ|nr:Translation initiation factor eIF-2B subunit delta [Melia azedarach]
MDSRRTSRAVIDPKVRQVGFFTNTPPPPDRSQSGPLAPIRSPPLADSPSPGNSLSPVMIPPPRHPSDTLLPRRPPSPSLDSDFFPPPSPTTTTSFGDFYDDVAVSPRARGSSGRGNSGKLQGASSFPGGGFEMPSVVKGASSVPASGLTTVSVVNLPPGISENAGGSVSLEGPNERNVSSKPLKEKTTKAERRALQEAQREAKAAAKAERSKAVVAPAANAKPAKAAKPASQKNDNAVGGDRPQEKDRKKDIPHPRMQYDDKSRVQKLKKRSVVKPTEARNIVELFRHLPQYEHGTQLPDLQSKFFQLDTVHPAVYKVGLQYLSGDICGGNARCIAMLQAFLEAIKDYSTPPEKTLSRDLTAKISSYVSFLIECRPLSISMGNAIRFLKGRIAKMPITLSESEAKAILQSDIDRFINEKIIVADKVIVKHAVTKIRDGDVLLTYGSSTAVEMILLHAHELGKQFRVVIVDSRPKLEGKLLLRRLVGKGLSCTYTHINAISYIMHEVTRVFLGASSILSNGTVYSRVGTACVAMVAHAFHVPVLVCCEAYKFHERVQLDSICSNELGDPDAISKVAGREDLNNFDGLDKSENLQLLNLTYDATPSDYVSMVITDYGMIPPTSVPVIVREYGRGHLWI